MTLVHRHLVDALPRLKRYALALTREPDAAHDLVQETALHALAATGAPQRLGQYVPWLLRIARNAFIDERRRVKRRPDDVLEAEAGTDPDSTLRALALRQALAHLDPGCRVIIERVDIEGLSYREAAAVLDIPVGTVMSRLSRARQRLLAALSEDKGETP